MTSTLRRRFGVKRSEVSHLIYHELRIRGYSGAKLARQLKCSGATVSKTINGLSHSESVLDALTNLGVPDKYLFDPRKSSTPSKVVSHV